jgi:protoheme IX farnesyltransferase
MRHSAGGLRARLGLLAELGKARISLLAALTALMGHALARYGLYVESLLPVLGTYILALGASSLNEYQERSLDARMARTRRRPLPSGRISPSAALAVAFAEILVGSVVLLATGRLTPWALGLAAVAWYNGLYTPLKRRSAFAVLPGSLIGALPPLIGWTAAGASLADPRILVVAFFFFIWQVPHFWLLMLKYGEQYRQAGLPSITDLFSRPQLARITFIWTLATGVACLMLPLFGSLRSPGSWAALAAAALWLVYQSARALSWDTPEPAFMRAFREINVFALVVILVALVDPYLTRLVALA